MGLGESAWHSTLLLAVLKQMHRNKYGCMLFRIYLARDSLMIDDDAFLSWGSTLGQSWRVSLHSWNLLSQVALAHSLQIQGDIETNWASLASIINLSVMLNSTQAHDNDIFSLPATPSSHKLRISLATMIWIWYVPVVSPVVPFLTVF